MYTAFEVHDAVDDALCVLTGGFDVGSLSAEAHLAGFLPSAGLPFVADAKGYNMHGVEGSNWVGRIACGSYHFQQCGVGTVYAVFGASVALGYPGTLAAFGDQMAQIGRHFDEALVIFHAVAATVDAEHFIDPSHLIHEGHFKEVGAHHHVSGVPADAYKQVLQQHGVQHDVAVVGDKEAGASVQVFGTRPGELAHGVFHHVAAAAVHGIGLKIAHVAIGRKTTPQVVLRQLGKERLGNPMLCQSSHHLPKLFSLIGIVFFKPIH